METILVVNAGSSSLKFQVFALAGEGEQRFWPQLSRDPDPFRTEETSSRDIDTSQRMLAPVIAVQDDIQRRPHRLYAGFAHSGKLCSRFVPPSKRLTSASEPKKPEHNPLPKRKLVVAHVKHPAIHIAQHQNPQTNW